MCNTCAVNNIQTSCTHGEKDRALLGTWVSLEIEEAIRQGYTILKIYEVWHYEQSSIYDKNTNSDGLFSSYVNLFLKNKQESSGFPVNVITEKKKNI